MELPDWVENEIRKFAPPQTGKVEIVLELYCGGVTKMELGGTVRVSPKREAGGAL